jgi:hypothetical protein
MCLVFSLTHQLPVVVSLDDLSVTAPRGSAAEDRRVKNRQPLLLSQGKIINYIAHFQSSAPLFLGNLRYELVVIDGLRFSVLPRWEAAHLPRARAVRVLSGARLCPPNETTHTPPPSLSPRLIRRRSAPRGLLVPRPESLVSTARLVR